MQETPDKGPIRHLSKHILKHDNEHNLTIIASQTHQLHKWLENEDIDKILSNDFWTNHAITDKQKTCLIKSALDNIWVTPGNNSSLAEKPSHREHVSFATPQMRIHDYMYYLNANNNIFMH